MLLLPLFLALIADTVEGQVEPRFVRDVLRRPRKKTVAERQAEAVAIYGETDNPVSVGFVLSDGRWVDFSEGSGGIRSLDHRNVGHLLDPDEQAPEQQTGNRAIDMHTWMDLAHAIRVNVQPGGHGHQSYALVDLPRDREALTDVLRARRSLLRLLDGIDVVRVGLQDGHVVDLDPYRPGELMAVLDEAMAWARR